MEPPSLVHENSAESAVSAYEPLIGALKRRCSIQESSATAAVASPTTAPSPFELMGLNFESGNSYRGATAGLQYSGPVGGIVGEAGVDPTARKIKVPRKPAYPRLSGRTPELTTHSLAAVELTWARM